MAERRLPIEDEFPNNSDRARERVNATKKPKKEEVQKVTKGKVTQKKKPLSKKFAEAFGAQEGQGVLEYIIYDIIIPATKNMIVDSIIDGAEMAILGEVRGRRSRRPGDRPAPRYSYDRPSYQQNDRRDRDRRYDRDQDRRGSTSSIDDYAYIQFDFKADAEEVISKLIDLIDIYGEVTVSDVYDSAGLTAPSPHLGNYGWTNLSSATVRRDRDGYFLDLPRAILL